MLVKKEANYDDSMNNSLAIVDIPLDIGAPVETMCFGDSAQPNSVLHDILTHQFEGIEGVAGLLEGGKEGSINDNQDDQIIRNENVSPWVNKLVKQTRKNKKQPITEKTLLSRSQLKGGNTISSNV